MSDTTAIRTPAHSVLDFATSYQAWVENIPPIRCQLEPWLPKIARRPTGLSQGIHGEHRRAVGATLHGVRTSFQFRLFPSKRQARQMQATLDECRWLYNHLLEQRKTAWDERQETLGLYEQQATFTALKAERPSLATVHSQVLQNVSVRLDLAMKAFFRRVKAGEKPGYPRFRGQGRYDSFCYPQSGFSLDTDQQRVTLSKIGAVRAVLHRPIAGMIKTCCVKRSSTGKWYVTFSCESVPDDVAHASTEAVGIDVGLTHFATLSTGEQIANPRFFRSDERALVKAQRRLAQETLGTPRRAKRRKPVARIHERIAFRRHDFTHQTARRIVNRFGTIAVEDLSISRMVHSHGLSKSIYDAAWGQFSEVLSSKAASAGRSFVSVNPSYTTQECSGCGHRQAMPLSERVYRCSCCGLHLDRDLNTAQNIRARGQPSLGFVPRSPRL